MISAIDLLAYAVALGVTAAIPGPGIAAVVARTIAGGAPAGYAMLLGLMLGDLVFLSFAVFGLGLLAQSFNAVFVVVRWLSIVFLLYLAWRFWFSEHQEVVAKVRSGKNLLKIAISGFAITFSNPKVIAFYLALLPLVFDLNSITVATWAGVLVPTTFVVLLAVGTVYILGVVRLRMVLSSAHAQKKLYRVASVAMAGAAFSMLIRDY